MPDSVRKTDYVACLPKRQRRQGQAEVLILFGLPAEAAGEGGHAGVTSVV